jgi:hypothetical protein
MLGKPHPWVDQIRRYLVPREINSVLYLADTQLDLNVSQNGSRDCAFCIQDAFKIRDVRFWSRKVV